MDTLAVRDGTTDAVLARLPLDASVPLRLSYVHSVYGQPGSEEFVASPTGLRLAQLASPSLAVLEYYARSEPIVTAGDGYRIQVQPCAGNVPCARDAAAPRLAVLASATGHRTIEHAGRAIALYALGATGDLVILQVERVPRALLLWPPAA